VLVSQVHLLLRRHAVGHQAVELAVRIDLEVRFVDSAPVHSEREEGFPVPDQAVVLIIGYYEQHLQFVVRAEQTSMLSGYIADRFIRPDFRRQLNLEVTRRER